MHRRFNRAGHSVAGSEVLPILPGGQPWYCKKQMPREMDVTQMDDGQDWSAALGQRFSRMTLIKTLVGLSMTENFYNDSQSASYSFWAAHQHNGAPLSVSPFFFFFFCMLTGNLEWQTVAYYYDNSVCDKTSLQVSGFTSCQTTQNFLMYTCC